MRGYPLLQPMTSTIPAPEALTAKKYLSVRQPLSLWLIQLLAPLDHTEKQHMKVPDCLSCHSRTSSQYRDAISEAIEFARQTNKSGSHGNNKKDLVKAEEPRDTVPVNIGVSIAKHAQLHPSSIPYAQTE